MSRSDAMRVEELDEGRKKLVSQCSDGMPPAEVAVGEGGWAMPRTYLKYKDDIRNMEVRPTDIWVLSFPKSGTTWTQEMTWVIGNNCDLDAAKKEKLHIRFPFLDFSPLSSEEMEFDSVNNVTNLPRDKPRFIKSHLPIELLPKDLFKVKPKMIYVCRDPRDVVLSYHHHYRLLNDFSGTLDDFFDAFLDEGVVFSPFWKHTLEFWRMQGTENFIFLRYEEMKKDLRSNVRRLAEFLDKEIPPGHEDAVVEHLTFSSMKKNSAVNFEADIKAVDGAGFMRAGEAGSWKKALSPEQVARMNEWSNKWLSGTQYPYFSNE